MRADDGRASDELLTVPHGRPRHESTLAGDQPPLLELTDLEMSFGGTAVLRGASLGVERGEIVGLSGEHGSGKSTLVKIIAGVLPHDSYRGELRVDGVVQRFSRPADAQRFGIAVVHQKLMLIRELSVAQNLMFGREPKRFGLVDEARLESEAQRHLAHFGFGGEIDPQTAVGDLAYSLQQIVEIVRALSQGARLLVLDEPTASLAPPERERLLSWLRTLKGTGTTCLYVSPRMEEVFDLCDRISVLREGKTAQTLTGARAARRSVRGRYTIHEEIASGGMATVHIGRIAGPFGFSSAVAVKRMYPQMARDPEFVAMFLDEARLASRVRHPNVVAVLDVLAEEGELCLVMEYVDGESLAQLMRSARRAGTQVPLPIAVSIISSILQGLHAAHQATDEQGAPLALVHRDVSPQNVIVGVDGVARLIDFGIAKAAGRSSVSRVGQVKGKIGYMAPEQLASGVVTLRSDIYGAAVLFWELIAGRRLFQGATEGIILGRVRDEPVPAPSQFRPGPSPELDALVLRGLDRDPERRFDSARAMARELEALVRPATPAEVGEWVESLAHATLAERREKLRRMERETE